MLSWCVRCTVDGAKGVGLINKSIFRNLKFWAKYLYNPDVAHVFGAVRRLSLA
jgi:hypothetical protein